MDAFYASVEQLDDPSLKGKPVIVGGSVRGVVSAASYEARTFGVRSAMPVGQARKLCPQGVFVPVRMHRYAEMSREVMRVLHDYSPVVEQASVDEAYLDATGLERVFGPVDAMAAQLKARVREVTGGLTCSVGLAPVKFLAKIASDVNKPDGCFILHPHEVEAFLRALPVGRIPGVGKRMLEALKPFGVRHVADVLRFSRPFWKQRFGKGGAALHERAQGIDTRELEPWTPPKSESAENTFGEDTRDPVVLKQWLMRQAERVGASLRKQGLAGRTVTLKVKYADFRQLTRSHTLREPVNATQTIFEEACALLDALHLEDKVRLIGLGVSQFGAVEQQLMLPLGNVEGPRDDAKRKQLDKALDALRDRHGKGAVVRGRLFGME